MGATGFGYELARQFGHAVLPTRAGLVPLTLSGKHQERLADLSGVALPVTAQCNGASFSNYMLVTHRGVSGPAILQISSFWQPGDELRIDLLPDQDALEALQQWQRDRPAAELKTVLGDVMPKRFAQRLCEHWLPNRPMKQFNAPQLREIAQVLSDWALVASGTEGYRTAEVTLGASTPTNSRRARCNPSACRACISSAKSSTSPAGSAVTTSSGRGLRAALPVTRCNQPARK
jgi:predicted flavoprotein YhiN